MFDWFNSDSAQQNFVQTPSFAYAKTQVIKDIDRFVEYYHSQPRYVNNSHILSRLLINLNVNLTRSNQEIVQRVSDIMIQSANPLGISTASNYGRVHSPGQFYNKGTEEIIFVHDTAFDIDLCYANWRHLQPVHVITHPFSDLSMQRLNGNYESDENGLVVIGINLPLLALQYKAWLVENQGRKSRQRVHHFIAMYVISNMIYTHMDLAYLNRLRKRYLREDVGLFIRKHPFFINNSSQLIDVCIGQVISSFGKRECTWEDIVWNIELFTESSMGSFLKPPDVIPTRQITWALTVGYMPHWELLCRLTLKNSRRINSFYTEQLKRYIRAMASDKLLERDLPKKTQNYLDELIINGINPSL